MIEQLGSATDGHESCQDCRVSSLSYGTSFIEGTASTAVTRNDFVFVYGLGADVEAHHHKQSIQCPGT